MMQSEVEHQEFHTEEAAVKSLRVMKKRHRGWPLSAGRRMKQKKRTRGDCGYQGKWAATCRKVSRHAAVAWRKRNLSRKIQTQVNCGPRQELGAAEIMMIRHTGVAWCKKGVR
jgi:hypothetical protein